MKTAYDMLISDWSSDVCASDLITRVVTSGIFSLDGGDYEVDNNVWVVGYGSEVVVIDAAHDHEPILAAIHGRRVVGIVATHAHNDHINAGAALAEATGAPILLHPDAAQLWGHVYPDRAWDTDLEDSSADGRVGKTWVSTGSPRWSPYQTKKKN